MTNTMNNSIKRAFGVVILILFTFGAYQFIYVERLNTISENVGSNNVIENKIDNLNEKPNEIVEDKKDKVSSQVVNSKSNNKELRIFLNNEEIKLRESNVNLELSHEKELITSLDKSIFTYKYFDINTTQNGNFYAGGGTIFNSRDENLSSNICYLMQEHCGQEEGAHTYLLEDGEGFISVCESQYIRIFRMKGRKFTNTQDGFWEIKSKWNNTEYYFGREVGLTQDGKYMYLSVNESPVKIRKYNLRTKELVWEKSIDDKGAVFSIFPSPFSDLIFMNGNEVYDKNLDKIKSFGFGGMLDASAYPRFFIHDGIEKLIVKGVKWLWILNLDDSKTMDKISIINSNEIDWFQQSDNWLLFQVKSEDNVYNLIELNLDDLSSSSKGKIMKSASEYKKGGKNTVVEIDGATHNTYTLK